MLGEQSMKSMRGKRGEDLIWNGSQTESRANRASVKVVFDNSLKIFDLDFEEVSVERAVHRDGENEYFINGSQVRLKDIIELLAKARIGSSGHHIISQGEADRIISANPKERKAMVEDALGLKLYQYKKVESEKKLEKTFENISQVEALKKEIAPHLRFLKKQAEKFDKSEHLREELLELTRELSRREEGQKHAFVGVSKDELIRELGQVEGLIMAEEKFTVKEEYTTVNLKEVENLYQEISLWQEAEKILERIKSFIQNKKRGGKVEKDVSTLRERQEKLLEAISLAELNLGLKRDIERLKIRLEEAGVAGSDEILKEYRETSERDEFLSRELADLKKSAESLKNLTKDLETRLSTEFETGLKNINKEFEKLFSQMFGGGEAELNLVREAKEADEATEADEAKIEEGLEIRVNLPRKKIKSLMMLSGGERALTSIALIFAISAVNPPPFIILDETDAALDEANSKKYGDLVETLSKYSQLILITHNRETMSRAGVIYGVTMGSNSISKVLSISFDEAIEVAK